MSDSLWAVLSSCASCKILSHTCCLLWSKHRLLCWHNTLQEVTFHGTLSRVEFIASSASWCGENQGIKVFLFWHFHPFFSSFVDDFLFFVRILSRLVQKLFCVHPLALIEYYWRRPADFRDRMFQGHRLVRDTFTLPVSSQSSFLFLSDFISHFILSYPINWFLTSTFVVSCFVLRLTLR